MFKCRTCKTLTNEVAFLREQVKSMTDRLVALANPAALQALGFSQRLEENDFYGTSEQDEVIEYDNYGQRILTKRVS